MFTNVAKNGIIDELTGQNVTAFNFSDMYVGLFDNAGVELTSASCPGYQRKLIGSPGSPLTRLFPQASGGSVANVTEIQFARATSDWTGVTVKGAGIFTSSVGGSQLTYDDFATPLSSIVQDMIVTIPVGSYTISFN